MSVVRAVLDTDALLAYVHDGSTIGELLWHAAERSALVGIPSTCLLEVFTLLQSDAEADMLRLLRIQPAIRVLHPGLNPVVDDELPFIGGMAKRLESLSAGHVAYSAFTSERATVFTARAEVLRIVLGAAWPIVVV